METITVSKRDNNSYEVAVESDYKCFILGKRFDSDDFICALK